MRARCAGSGCASRRQPCSSRWSPVDLKGGARGPCAEPAPDRADWIEGSFRFDSYDAAVRELLGLGSEVEVLRPVELRETMAGIGRRMAALHARR